MCLYCRFHPLHLGDGATILVTEGSCDTDMLAGAAVVRQNKNPPHVTAE